MIVRQFLHWLRTAPSGHRAEATSALARAALAEVFAGCADAPPTVVHALASDQPDVAAPILQRSPLLLDADLVEAVAGGESERQIAIASRAGLPCSVSAAI